MDSVPFSQRLSMLVSSSFASGAANLSDSAVQGKLTFHQCLRTSFGTNPEWSLLAYRNSGALLDASIAVYGLFSAYLGSNSEHWLQRSERSADEVAHVIQVLSKSLDALEIPVAVVRPGIRRVQGPGKPRAAIAVEAAVASSLRGVSYGMVLSEGMSSSSNDHEMVAWLEENAKTEIDEKRVDWTIAKAFSLSAGAWLRSAEETTVRAYCHALEVDLSTVINDVLLKRINEIRRLSDARLRSS